MSAPALSPAPTTPGGAFPGRHHRRSSVRGRVLRTIELVGRVGSLVSLAALVVVAGAVGGLFDGTPAGSDATVTATRR